MRSPTDFALPALTDVSAGMAKGKRGEIRPGLAFGAWFDLIPLSTVQINLDTAKILRMSRRFTATLGPHLVVTRETSFLDLIHPDDRRETLAAVKGLRGGEITEWSRPLRLLHPSAAPLDGQVTIISGLAETDGPPVGFVFLQDISARKMAEAAWHVSEARLRSVMAIETVGILFFTLDGAITGANEAFLRLTGSTQEELNLGRLRWDENTPWVATLLRTTEDLKAHGTAVRCERRYIRKDGTEWWGLLAATKVSEEEGVAVVIDVTTRRRAEDEVRRYQERLDELVVERTAELDEVNATLRDEILEHKRTQAQRHTLQNELAKAQEEERRRISRELHDQVGQELTALLLKLKSVESAPPDEALKRLKEIQQLAETIGREIHELARELRPAALDDLGFVRALSDYADAWSARTGVAVDAHIHGFECEGRLPAEIETALYRIAGEALNNVFKHARARHVSLIVERRPDQVTVIVEDDGCGFDVAAQRNNRERLGILGMTERVTVVGGEVNIESAPGRGTTVFVRVPLPAQKGAS